MRFALLFLSATLFAARPITETDIYRFRWAADPQISPDASQVAFTLVTVNAKKDGYDTAVFLVPARGGVMRRLTAGPRDGSPRWSPDGKQMVFVRAPQKGPGQLFLLPLEGGEARQLTDLPKGASNPAWSPDGKAIAFASVTAAQDLEKKAAGAEEDTDVRVITRAVYRANGGGYVDYDRPNHIWTVPVTETLDKPASAKALTSGRFSESEFVWSRDGKQIYFVSNRDLEPYYRPPAAAIYSIPATGGEARTLAALNGTIRALSLSPDGRHLAFIGVPNGDRVRSYSQPDLFVTALTGEATPRNLTVNFDNDIGGGLTGDQHPPRGAERSTPFWSADSKSLFVIAAEEGRANLKRVDVATGSVAPVTDNNHDLYSLTATPDGTKAVLAISTPTRIGDLHLLQVATRSTTRLTDLNAELFSGLSLTEPEMIWYKSFDGRRIQTWIQRPPNYDPARKYPLILNIHGGPHAAYGYTFDHEFQWMAAKGYVVLYPNPRGSTSYGQEFGNMIQHKYPGDDSLDLLAGVDELIRRGVADPERLGVTGGSGGGVLTNWIVGRDHRFQAAVSQRSIADWAGFWYTADFALFRPTWFAGPPWEDPNVKFRSPITYVDKIRTPMMFIEGDADLRTPPSDGGEMMFRALKFRKVPTVMVQFPGENHELSRSGKPTHRVERLRHIVAWFDKYLLGANIAAYDVQ